MIRCTRNVCFRVLSKSLPALIVCIGLSVPMTARSETYAQAGYSPEGSARELVLSVINAAQHEIRVLSYSFTAFDIADALIKAKQRGVDVKMVLDYRGNKDKFSQAAIRRVSSAGIPLKLDDAFSIQHDKTIIVDGDTVETGSFNFTSSAEKRNSENAVVIWHLPSLAHSYLVHWQDRWNRGFAP